MGCLMFSIWVWKRASWGTTPYALWGVQVHWDTHDYMLSRRLVVPPTFGDAHFNKQIHQRHLMNALILGGTQNISANAIVFQLHGIFFSGLVKS